MNDKHMTVAEFKRICDLITAHHKKAHPEAISIAEAITWSAEYIQFLEGFETEWVNIFVDYIWPDYQKNLRGE